MLFCCIKFSYVVGFTGGVDYFVLLNKLLLCCRVYWWNILCCFVV